VSESEHYCPRCNAPFLCFNGVNTRHFKCGSSAQIPSVACGYASQLQDRIKRLEAAGDKLSDCADQIGWTSCESPQWIKKAENAVKEWRKAKEDKL
jgi:hypothetical protein